jgi:5-methylcytosine-specific restriction endonuclease McrA
MADSVHIVAPVAVQIIRCTTPLKTLIRQSARYVRQRIATFERDNHQCQICNKRGGTLNAHHIKSFSNIWNAHSISNIREALECEALWDLDNLITLCADCHKKVHQMERIDNDRRNT